MASPCHSQPCQTDILESTEPDPFWEPVPENRIFHKTLIVSERMDTYPPGGSPSRPLREPRWGGVQAALGAPLSPLDSGLPSPTGASKAKFCDLRALGLQLHRWREK